MKYVNDLDMLNSHVDNLVQFVESFESLYQRCIGQRDISLEGFKQYQTELTNLAYRHSFDISGTLNETSLESVYSLSFEADDQKKNIFRRAWDAFIAVLTRIYETLTGENQKREKITKGLEKMRTEIQATVAETAGNKSANDPSSPTRYTIEIPRGLHVNWGYDPVAKSTHEASKLHDSLFDLIMKIKDSTTKSQIEQILKQAKVLVDKLDTLANDPKLNAMATDMVEMSSTADRVREIIKSTERIYDAYTYLHLHADLVEERFKAIIARLKKTPLPVGVDISTEIGELGKLIAAAQLSLNKIIKREKTCYAVVSNTVTRLRRVLTEQ